MADTLGLQPIDGPCYGLNWLADPGQTEIVGQAPDGSRHLYRQRDQVGTVHHVREVEPAPVPYYAARDFSPPPFADTLDVPEDRTDWAVLRAPACWRCDSAQATSDVGLCEACYEYLRDTDDAPS